MTFSVSAAMAMEQGVDVAAVLLAMRVIVNDWGHVADPPTA